MRKISIKLFVASILLLKSYCGTVVASKELCPNFINPDVNANLFPLTPEGIHQNHVLPIDVDSIRPILRILGYFKKHNGVDVLNLSQTLMDYINLSPKRLFAVAQDAGIYFVIKHGAGTQQYIGLLQVSINGIKADLQGLAFSAPNADKEIEFVNINGGVISPEEFYISGVALPQDQFKQLCRDYGLCCLIFKGEVPTLNNFSDMPQWFVDSLSDLSDSEVSEALMAHEDLEYIKPLSEQQVLHLKTLVMTSRIIEDIKDELQYDLEDDKELNLKTEYTIAFTKEYISKQHRSSFEELLKQQSLMQSQVDISRCKSEEDQQRIQEEVMARIVAGEGIFRGMRSKIHAFQKLGKFKQWGGDNIINPSQDYNAQLEILCSMGLPKEVLSL